MLVKGDTSEEARLAMKDTSLMTVTPSYAH